MDIVRAFRVVSIAEAVSFLLLLLVAMPLKYMADMPAAVSLVGAIHGALFVAYIGAAVLVRQQLGWNLTRTVLAMGAAVLPVAPFFVERHWTKPAPVAEPAGRA
ncbi:MULTISPECIES: DUF3817 domain-containing protein [Actinomadura]|uniref:DUF3817 domain-containing protein n=1 Tax=Actinomadura TaxID=1988 RepID=UPI0003F593F0|nr:MULTISPECIES: DUF3817 domain-containing protein [Actinomadura]RSN57724.1 DUF3817 domain-containing protein [Actinomadura sp. WAC 06369]